MTYQEWTESVPREITGDPLWRLEDYRLSLFAADLAWQDVTKLMGDKRTIGLADQLYRSVGAVSSDIAEGYGRQSGKDQAKYYEYALGSAREGRNWYYEARHVLTERVANHRIELMTQIVRLLLTIIPSERSYRLQEESAEPRVDTNGNHLLQNVPLPSDRS